MTGPLPAPPPAPPGFSADEFFAGAWWHQRWEVFAGVFTPGRNPVAELCARAQLPADLTGKRVLDLGAWNGAFSFECERRGAREVVALGLENPAVSGFHQLRALLGSRVSYVQGSVYELSPAALGRFDVILFFGVLYHLRYPLLALDRLRGVCADEVLVETHLLTDRHLLRAPRDRWARWLRLSRWFADTPLWRQYRPGELHPDDRSNWFAPNACALAEAFASAGFTTEPLAAWADRATFRARPRADAEKDLLADSYEAWSPANARLAGVAVRENELYNPPAGPA